MKKPLNVLIILQNHFDSVQQCVVGLN